MNSSAEEHASDQVVEWADNLRAVPCYRKDGLCQILLLGSLGMVFYALLQPQRHVYVLLGLDWTGRCVPFVPLVIPPLRICSRVAATTLH
jgi:hypothetical protein